jgi:predicted dehydrogenase
VTLGVGVIGLGFIGGLHVRAWSAAAAAGHDVRLAAVCDKDRERRAGRAAAAGNLGAPHAGALLFDPRCVRAYERPSALLDDPDVAIVSICTYTETHVDLACAALEAGRHVLVEKPVALHAADAARLLEAARVRPDRLCMPALCMRFWPGWDWLLARVADGRHGPVRRAAFRRLSPAPSWGSGFYGDEARSGAALFDLHVHDADLVRAAFGPPSSLASRGSARHVVTEYAFRDGPEHVVAEGGWLDDPGAVFSMSYTVEFEQCVAHWSSAHDPPLTLRRRGATEELHLPAGTGYDGEVRHLLAWIAARDAGATGPSAAAPAPHPDAMLADMVPLTAMLEAERESLRTGRAITR